MNFIVKTDLEKALPAVIDFNFKEMKAELTEKLAFYNSLVVTEDSIKTGKDERAKLNKLEKAINDKKIEVKKQCLAPYETFETKCKELIGMISEASSSIDCQIKAFEDKEIEDKLTAITDFYKHNINGLQEVLSLEKLLNPKWKNKTTTLLSITQEMVDKIMTVKNDLKIIETMKLDCEIQMKDAYLRNLNMSEALAEKTRFEEQQKRLEEIKDIEMHTQARHMPPAQETSKSIEEPIQQEELVDVKSIIYGTNSAFRAEMRALLQKYGLKCEGIK